MQHSLKATLKLSQIYEGLWIKACTNNFNILFIRNRLRSYIFLSQQHPSFLWLFIQVMVTWLCSQSYIQELKIVVTCTEFLLVSQVLQEVWYAFPNFYVFTRVETQNFITQCAVNTSAINVDGNSSVTNWSIWKVPIKVKKRVKWLSLCVLPAVYVFVTEYVAYNYLHSKTGSSWIFQGNKTLEKGM
jgi:hypothetical protein